MNALSQCFARLKSQNRQALMPYLTLGWPHFDSALEIVPALIEGGADILELGIPFSDPLADGPVIQAASHKAIQNGMTATIALKQIGTLRKLITLPPVVVMTYTNVLMSYGFVQFAADANSAGVSGVIAPDLPPEHSDELQAALESVGIALVFMVTPNLPEERIKTVVTRSTGFIYMVSVLGITGERREMPDMDKLTKCVRRHTNLPIALGFGISTPMQARTAALSTDGVIIGSALIRSLSEHPGAEADAARAFCRKFRFAIDTHE
jgi:tryptophan synthase alpha chain